MINTSADDAVADKEVTLLTSFMKKEVLVVELQYFARNNSGSPSLCNRLNNASIAFEMSLNVVCKSRELPGSASSLSIGLLP